MNLKIPFLPGELAGKWSVLQQNFEHAIMFHGNCFYESLFSNKNPFNEKISSYN